MDSQGLRASMKIDQALRPRRPVRQLAVLDDGAPPQRCPCCPCRGAEKVWLGAIRPFDSVARPRDRRSVVGVGLKEVWRGAGTSFVDAKRSLL